MPSLGEVRSGRTIGYTGGTYVWHSCVDCGKLRWVEFIEGQPQALRCNSCAQKGERSHSYGKFGSEAQFWKGGRTICRGYVLVWVSPNDFYYPMATRCRRRRGGGYILEHRLVMAKSLGRCLQPWEIVHHKGIRHSGIENRLDNLRDNLELTLRGNHVTEHSRGYRDGYKKGLADGRMKELQELKEQNRRLLENIKLLQWQIKELRIAQSVASRDGIIIKGTLPSDING